MKKAVFILPFTLLMLSCRKNEVTDFQKCVTGTWELQRRICGECTDPLRIYANGNGNVIVLAADGTYERRKQDTLVFKGTYTLKKHFECNKTSGDIALFTNEYANASPLYMILENGKLQLSTPYCYADGAITEYRKVK